MLRQTEILWLLSLIQLFRGSIYLFIYCYKYTVYTQSLVKNSKSSLPLTGESQVKDICTVECPSTCNSNKEKIKMQQFY